MASLVPSLTTFTMVGAFCKGGVIIYLVQKVLDFVQHFVSKYLVIFYSIFFKQAWCLVRPFILMALRRAASDGSHIVQRMKFYWMLLPEKLQFLNDIWMMK